MSKQRKLRIGATIAACLCLLALGVMAACGMNTDFSDSLLLAMKLTGGAGVVLLLLNAVLAVWELDKSRDHQKGK